LVCLSIFLQPNHINAIRNRYGIPSFLDIPEKTQLSTQVLISPPNDLPFQLLNITYFSAASFPLAFPPLVAKGFGWPKIGLGLEGVNERVGKWLVDLLGSEEEEQEKGGKLKTEEKRVRGWAFMDYYDSEEAVVPLLVEGNFRGRQSGEEGWI
jgi:1-phosphatidylinositol phosphodiesterase